MSSGSSHPGAGAALEATPPPTVGLRRLAGDSALYGIAAAAAKALALLSVPYLSRALTPEGYGIADLATGLAALLTLVASFAGDVPTARDRGRTTDSSVRDRLMSSYVWTTAAVSVAAAGLLLPMAPLITGALWRAPDQLLLAALTLILVPLSATQAALASIQRLEGRARSFSVLAMIDLLAQLGLAVLLVALGFGAVGVVAGFCIGSAIGLLAAFAAGRRQMSYLPSARIGARLVAAGLPFLPAIILFVLADYASRYVLVASIGADAVGAFGVALRVASVITLVATAFATAWGPLALGMRPGAGTARLFARVLWAYSGATCAVALVVAAIAPELVRIVAGSAFAGAAVIVPGMVVASALAGGQYALLVAAGVADRDRSVTLSSFAGAGAQVLLTVILVPSIGLGGAGIGAMAGRMVALAALAPAVRVGFALSWHWLAATWIVTCGAAVVIQALNHAGSDTLAWRLVIAVGAVGGLGIAVSRQQWRDRRRRA